MDRTYLQPGTQVDVYKIIRVVGAGGFGVTYEAEDLNLRKIVALKEYYPEEFSVRTEDAQVRPTSARQAQTFEWGRASFVQEARTLAKFRHAGIVEVYRVFEANSTAYMIMEYERGPSLEKWRHDLNRCPTQAELDRLVPPILDALAALHTENFLHRDISPDNIIIRTDGRPVLLDFGSARHAVAAKTRALTGLVKQGFSPQEQYAQDSRFQGPWSDLYALGATLYWLVTGRAPDEATNRSLHDTLVPAVQTATGDYRKDFLEGIDACLKIKPAQRPQTVAELRAMLAASPHRPDRTVALPEKTRVMTTAVAADTAPTKRLTIPSGRGKLIAAGLAASAVIAAVIAYGLYSPGRQREAAQDQPQVRQAQLPNAGAPSIPFETPSLVPKPEPETDANPEPRQPEQRTAPLPPVPASPWTAPASEIAGWRLKNTARLGGALSDTAVSRDRTMVAVAAQREGSVHVIDAATLKVRAKIALPNYEAYSLNGVAILADKRRLVVLRGTMLETYDIDAKTRIGTVSLAKGYDKGLLASSKDGRRLYVISSSINVQRSTLGVYAVGPQDLELETSIDFEVRIDSFDATTDDTRFVLGTYPTNELTLYDAQERRFIWSRRCDCSARFTENDTRIVFAGRLGQAIENSGKPASIGLIDVADPDQMEAFDAGTTETLYVTDVSPNGRYAAVGSTNIGQVFVMPVDLTEVKGKLRPLVVLKDNSGQSISGALFVGRDSLVTTSGDNNARLWKK